MSLGAEVIPSRAALEAAPFTVALVNPRMPRTVGGTSAHLSRFPLLVEVGRPLPTLERGSYADPEARIGAHVAGLGWGYASARHRGRAQRSLGSL